MKLASTLLKYFLGIAAIYLVAVIILPTGSRGRPNARRSSCQSNLKFIGLAIREYMQDYDQRFPVIQTRSNRGWADSIRPHAISPQIFNCAENPRKSVGDLTDYFYNGRLSGAKLKVVSCPSSTILAGDGNLDAPGNASLSALPQGWRDYKNAPAYRHLEGANYVFVDGHTKWLKPERVTAKRPDKTEVYTFLPQ